MTNPLGSVPLGSVPLIESHAAYDSIEDWSGCRSISRAIRRAKLGHKQRMVIHTKPKAFMINGVMYAHPVIIAELRKQNQSSHKENHYD